MLEILEEMYAGTATPGDGGSGGGAVSSVNGQTGAVTLDADDVLPSQTGNSGKFITTDGTNASWASISALQNTATGTNALTLIGNPTSYNNSINIGYNSKIFGDSSVNIGVSGFANTGCIAVGCNTSAGGNSSFFSTAIGNDSSCAGGGYSTIIGYNISCYGYGSVVLGARSDLVSESGVFYVALSQKVNDLPSTNTYKLLDYDGIIPAARHATLPSSDGTYTLKLTISNGTPTLSWVAD